MVGMLGHHRRDRQQRVRVMDTRAEVLAAVNADEAAHCPKADSQPSRLVHIDVEGAHTPTRAWDPRHGDRHTAMSVLVYDAHCGEILDALNGALFTDAELGFPQDWSGYADPFGDWHEDLDHDCVETADDVPAPPARNGDR